MKEIKIYVANLGKYNEGELVGEWFTLPEDVNVIRKTIGLDYVENGKLIKTGYEEYAIHDYEAPFDISEYASIERLNEIAKRIEEMNELDVKIACALVDNGIVSDIMDAFDEIENVNIYYDCNDMSDVAYAFYEETGMMEQIPEQVRYYIDWESVGRDMEINGTFFYLGNNTYGEYIE